MLEIIAKLFSRSDDSFQLDRRLINFITFFDSSFSESQTFCHCIIINKQKIYYIIIILNLMNKLICIYVQNFTQPRKKGDTNVVLIISFIANYCINSIYLDYSKLF